MNEIQTAAAKFHHANPNVSEALAEQFAQLEFSEVSDQREFVSF